MGLLTDWVLNRLETGLILRENIKKLKLCVNCFFFHFYRNYLSCIISVLKLFFVIKGGSGLQISKT